MGMPCGMNADTNPVHLGINNGAQSDTVDIRAGACVEITPTPTSRLYVLQVVLRATIAACSMERRVIHRVETFVAASEQGGQ